MTVDRDTIALCALGLATPEQQAEVAADPGAAAELLELQAAVGALAASVPGVAPSAHVRDRLLASVGGGRFERFVARFAEMYDLVADRAREVLGTIERPSTWSSPFPGMEFAVFRGGARYATSDCGLLRVAPGAAFPWHGHTSEETSLFLAGVGRDHEGRVYVAGDVLVQPIGSAHAFSTISDDPLIVAVRHRGVDFAAKRPA